VKADESIPDPKGRESWTQGLSPAQQPVLGPREGAIIAFLDPEHSAVRLGGEGHTPLWQYSRESAKLVAVWYQAPACSTSIPGRLRALPAPLNPAFIERTFPAQVSGVAPGSLLLFRFPDLSFGCRALPHWLSPTSRYGPSTQPLSFRIGEIELSDTLPRVSEGNSNGCALALRDFLA
jgi:hypothetical protein